MPSGKPNDPLAELLDGERALHAGLIVGRQRAEVGVGAGRHVDVYLIRRVGGDQFTAGEHPSDTGGVAALSESLLVDSIGVLGLYQDPVVHGWAVVFDIYRRRRAGLGRERGLIVLDV